MCKGRRPKESQAKSQGATAMQSGHRSKKARGKDADPSSSPTLPVHRRSRTSTTEGTRWSFRLEWIAAAQRGTKVIRQMTRSAQVQMKPRPLAPKSKVDASVDLLKKNLGGPELPLDFRS